MAGWFMVNGSLVCVPAKCGGTSFYRAAFKVPKTIDDRHVYGYVTARVQPMNPSQAFFHSFRPALLAVRDPVARFMSLWRDKCRDGDDNMPWMKSWTPVDLASFIEKMPHGDPHWAPQSDYMIPGATPVRHERMLRRLGLVDVAANQTMRYSDDPEPIEDWIRSIYRADVLLHQSAEGV